MEEKLSVKYVYKHTLKQGEGKFWKILLVNIILAIVIGAIPFGFQLFATTWTTRIVAFVFQLLIGNMVLVGAFWLYQDLLNDKGLNLNRLTEGFKNYRKTALTMGLVQCLIALAIVPIYFIPIMDIIGLTLIRLTSTVLIVDLLGLFYIVLFVRLLLSFTFVPFILAEKSELGIIPTLGESFRLMQKRGWQLFTLLCSILWPCIAILFSMAIIFVNVLGYIFAYTVIAAFIISLIYCLVVCAAALPTFYQEVKLYDKPKH